MTSLTVNLHDDLATVLREQGRPLDEAIQELVVMELFRRHIISGGKVRQVLRLDFEQFLRRLNELGIPFFDMSPEEFDAEVARIKAL